MLICVATCYVPCVTNGCGRLLLDESRPGCLELLRSRAGGLVAGGRRSKSGGGRRLLPVPQNVQRSDSCGLDGAAAASATGRLADRCSVGPLERWIRSGSRIQTVKSQWLVGGRNGLQVSYILLVTQKTTQFKV